MEETGPTSLARPGASIGPNVKVCGFLPARKKPTLVDKVAGKRRPGNEKKRSVAAVS